ncbi:FMRFamide-activated amiloride-sensitive sodium channel-like isoform X1 [Biomphalaria pfeifferi]|uniref:FMRFamide-activated amiloride-sensitive sodium channel-like isoform X1 n=1 Tax=Biomphalaria pfeifferi TaxID=112525 RepID=A0AAD8C094_BIOPF|nr:FMRFamide-activated amiloride-sensitive sodium channel-like isoform X1 [Biomphalaria pfeifferi]
MSRARKTPAQYIEVYNSTPTRQTMFHKDQDLQGFVSMIRATPENARVWEASNHMKYSNISYKPGAYPDNDYGGRTPPNYHPNRTALDIIAELGSESNAHGLAKIVASRDTKRKVIWALLVIIGFTAATLQLSLLVRKYLQFQVVELSEIKDSMPVEYPSVTICNTEPISLRKIRKSVTKDKSEELRNWVRFIDGFRFEQMSFIHSIRAFYENLGEEAKKISHDLKDMLIHCRFNRELCSVKNFTTSFDGNYFNCFTFNGGHIKKNLEMHGTGPENGLSLIISVEKDDPLPGTYGIYNFENNILHSAGVRLVVHAPGSMPSPVDHGIDIPPGYSSSVGLKAVLHSRLPEPYGNCSEGTLQGMHKYRNTFFACLQLCKQRLIMSTCGCKSSALPDLPTENVTFCGEIPDWEDILMNVSGKVVPGMFIPTPALECEERMQRELNNDRAYEMSCQCFQPCSETSYLKSVSLSYWPLEFYQLNLLERFLNDNDTEHFMNIAYDYLAELARKGHDEEMSRNSSNSSDWSYTNQDKLKSKAASDLIRQTMLRLNIYLEDLSVVEYRQLPAYGLADLFADIGGTLGLWMGISVLTIMELMELIIRLIGLMFNVESDLPPDEKDERHTEQKRVPAPKTHNGGSAPHESNYPDPYGPPEFNFRRGVEHPTN